MKSLIVLIILTSNTALAADKIDRTRISSALSKIESKQLVHEDKIGIWFPVESAGILLNLIETTLPAALSIIDDQSRQILALKSANASYKLSIDQYKELGDLNKQMYKIAMDNMSKWEPVELAWYESSTAMFMYGLAVGVATIVLSSWVLDNVQVK